MRLKIDYDTLWKELISEFFEDFTAFFMPKLHKDIDFLRPVEFLEQELLDIFKTKYKGKRINDKLVKVYLKNGKQKWILIHIEVQASFEKDFAERMFLYYALIYAKYGVKDITAIAIFTDNKIPKHYDTFTYSTYGTTISYKFNEYRIAIQDENVLLKSNNPFAFAVLANLYLINTKQKYDNRYTYKEMLFKIAKNKNFDEKRMIRLLIFVRHLMVLPKMLEQKFTIQHPQFYIPNTMGLLDLLTDDDRAFFAKMHQPQIRFLANELAQELAQDIAKDMAQDIAKDMAKDIAKDIAQNMASETIDAEKKKLYEEKQQAQIETMRKIITRYYHKHGRNGLEDMCDLVEIDMDFAENIIKELEK